MIKKVIYFLYIFVLSNPLLAQYNGKAQSTIESDFYILTGKLDNGMNYIIKPIEGDTGKIEASLVVHAGANQEDTDQYQIAHLLEHLASTNTESFPSLRSNENLFAPFKISSQDYTAFVGGNITKYNLKYHQEFPETLDMVFSIFHDIASGKVLFDENIVHTEKKALYQEYLYTDTGKSYPEYKVQNLLSGCRDFVPSPSNFETVLMNSSVESLKQFYLDWYRPDLMTIYIIGNIKDVEQVQSKIKEKFEDIKMPANPREKKNCLQKYGKRPKQFIIHEKGKELHDELPAPTQFQFYYPNSRISFPQFSENENEVLWNVLTQMIENRLKSQQGHYNRDYKINFYEINELPARLLEIRVFDPSQEVITQVFQKMGGISEFGFTPDELNNVVDEKLKIIETMDYSTASFWSSAIQHSLTFNVSLPVSRDNMEIEFLKRLNIKDFNLLIKNNFDWMPNDIAIIKTKDFKKNKFLKRQINKSVKQGLRQPVRYQSQIIPELLLTPEEISKLPTSQILKHTMGIWNEDIIELENGVNIIIKQNNPTGRSKDRIMIHGYSPEGASCFGDRDYDAMFAPLIIQHSGAGPHDKFTKDKILENTSLPFGVYHYIEQNETGVKAEIHNQDLEILLQLIYLSFSQPRYDYKAFENWKTEEHSRSLRNKSANNDFIDFINEKEGIYTLPLGINRFKKIQDAVYDEAFKKYKHLHSNAGNFTFIITGNIDITETLPILQRYLGNLPNKRNYTCQDNKNDKILALEGGYLPLAQHVDNNFLSIKFVNPFPINPEFKEEIELEFIRQALLIKLRELRHKKNLGVYLSSASGSFDYNKKTSTIQIYLQSNRDDFNEVIEACNTFFEELKTSQVTNDFLSTVKESGDFSKWREGISQTNKMISNTLYDYYKFNVPIVERKQAQEFVESFTAEDLQNAAKIYFNEDNRVLYIGKPEMK